MPIKSISLKTYNNIHSVNSIKKNLPTKEYAEIHLQDATNFQFTGKITTILEKITGSFSKEDFLQVEKLKKEYSKISIDDIKKQHSEKCKKFFPDIFAKITTDYNKEKNLYLYEPKNITPEKQKEIKEYVIDLYAMKKIINKETPRLSGIPYSEWLNTNLGLQFRKLAGHRFEHPCDKALKHTGAYNKSDIELITNFETKYKNSSINQIWERKGFILDKIDSLLSKANPDFIGDYSDKEFRLMKILSAEYTALNRCQTRLGYNTKTLEAVLYSKSNKYVKNEYIEGLGLITDKLKIDNKPVIIVFSNDYKRHSLKMYDLNKLQKREEFLKNIPNDINITDLQELNSNSKQLILEDSSAKIAEIYFEVAEKENIKKQINENKTLKTDINELIDSSKYIYYISSFRNFNKKEYPSGAKVLGIKLLKFLKDKQIYPLFLKAEPYEGTHSPVSLYLRTGFEPITESKEEILKNMSNNRSEYQGEAVFMYMKDFENSKNLIEKMNSFYGL